MITMLKKLFKKEEPVEDTPLREGVVNADPPAGNRDVLVNAMANTDNVLNVNPGVNLNYITTTKIQSDFKIFAQEPTSFRLGENLIVQEDGRIIVSSELKRSMPELAEDFWKEVTKRFPVSSHGQRRIEHMKEGIKAAMDACEACDDASCVACEILKTAMSDHVEPKIEEMQEGTVDCGGDFTIQPSGIMTVGDTGDMGVDTVHATPPADHIETTITLGNKENDNE